MADTSIILKYRNVLKRLLPIGKAWRNSEKLLLLLKGLAVEFCRVDERGQDLLKEIDPNQTVELLGDWETMVGLPDECTPIAPTIEERRNQVVQRLADTGGLSAAFYEEVIANLGFDSDVYNLLPFRSGRGRSGDCIGRAHPTFFRSGVGRSGDRLTIPSVIYYFVVDTELVEDVWFRSGAARSGDRIRSFGNQVVECTIMKLKPAHAGVIFKFGK